MLRVALVGWRGMVGSVLLERMRQEGDLTAVHPIFFSTSNVGGPAPEEGGMGSVLKDANDLTALATCDVVVSCQGGDYTSAVYKPLRDQGWTGYWIDAASTLRMQKDTTIILDPVNARVIQDSLANGMRTFAGGNCTVSLMLMAVGGLFKAGLVEWMTTMTYQAASGAGAAKMLELARQMEFLTESTRQRPTATALEIDSLMTASQRSAKLPAEEFGVALAASLIPWIDRDMPGGQTREEWKGMAETNKILGLEREVPVDGICVRIGSMRCHGQALCIKLNKDLPLHEIEGVLRAANPWVRIVPNDKESTLRCLSPVAVSDSLLVPVGRLHKLKLGPKYLGAFTVGDQLLWGAAEPLRRMLAILRAHLEDSRVS